MRYTVQQSLCRQPETYQAQIDDQMRHMLEAAIIIASSSPWCSTVGLVEKKDGRLRFAVAYKHINAITTIPAYPVTGVDACSHSFGDSA